MERRVVAWAAPIALVFLISCSQEAGRNTAYNSSGFDIEKDEAAWADTVTRRVPEPCDTLHDPAFVHASPMTRQMLRGERYDLQDEVSAFAVLDSFKNARDAATREFYFLVMTRALKWSDGYYSEGISVAGYGLYDSLPCEFLSHFNDLECLDDSDLVRWSQYLGFEFFLDAGDLQSGKLDSVQAWMREMCRDCSKMERQVAERMNIEFEKMVRRMDRNE